MYRIATNALGKSILRASRLRGGGTALPGLVVEKISPNYLAKTSQKLKGGSIIVTGTNGKTTTSKMLRGILEASGKIVVANRAGSNMTRGIVSTLLENSKITGGLKGEVGLFEVDEAFVPEVARQLRPKVIAVLNLLRDQLDRYGELDRTAHLIGSGLEHAEHVVLNADDPLVADLAKYCPNAKVHYFGASPHLRKHLPDDANLFKASNRPGVHHAAVEESALDVLLRSSNTAEELQKIVMQLGQQKLEVKLPLDGIYNAYNAAAALSVAIVLGIDSNVAARALEHTKPAFGRTELVEVGGKRVQLLLVKNPSGFNQIIKTFLNNNKDARVMIAINDNFADGRDVSWLWDVDFEQLTSRGHHVLTTGTRGLDLSVRLKYADIKSSNQNDLTKALNQFLHSLPGEQIGYIVPTYTAMLQLRRLLGKRTTLSEVWE